MLTEIIACGLLVLFARQVDSKPAETAVVLLERAAVAERLGELAKARDLLAKAWNAGDPAVKRTVEARQADLQKKLAVAGTAGGQDPSAQRASAGTSSPLQRRFAGALENFLTGALKAGEMSEIAGLTGDDGLPILAAWLDDAATSTKDIGSLFSVVAMIAQRNPTSRAPVDFLVKYSKRDDAYIRKRAMSSLESLSSRLEPWATELANEYARSPYPEGRVLAITLFNVNKDRNAVKPFMPAFARDASPDVRAALVDRFAAYLTADDRAALLADKESSVRRAVVGAAKKGEWDEPSEALLRLALDDSLGTARDAMIVLMNRGLAGVKPSIALPLVRKIATSKHEEVRAYLVRGFRPLNELGAEGVPITLGLVNDESESIAKNALSIFSNMPDSAYSRAYRNDAIQALREASARYPLRLGQAYQSGPSDVFADWFSRYVRRVLTREDLPELLPLLLLVPSPTDGQRTLTEAILDLATEKDFSTLRAFLDTCKSSELRTSVMFRAIAIAQRDPASVKGEFVPLLQRAFDESADQDDLDSVVRGICALGAPELGKQLLTGIERLDVARLGHLQLGPYFASAPETAMRALVRIVTRQVITGNTGGHDQSQQYSMMNGQITPVTAPIVAEFLLDPAVAGAVAGQTAVSNSFGQWAEYLTGSMAGLADPLGAELLTRLATAGPSSTVRAAAFKAMGKSKSPSLTAVLVEKGLTDETDYARRMAVKSLAERRNYDDATVQRVAALGADDKGWSKDQVLDYFVVWNDLKALPYLRSFLKDPNPNNRVAACKALGLYMSEDPVPDLLELLADPKESVRVAAKDVLERIRFYNEEKRRWQDWKRAGGDTPAEGLRKLLTALDDKDAEVRIAAIESLGTMKAREALPTLVERLKSTPAGAEREALTKAIAKINQ